MNEGQLFASKANNPEINNEKIPKRGKFQRVGLDGTVSFYDTMEQLQEAIEEERENRN